MVSQSGGAAVGRPRPFFFIHIMKTAGTSFRQHVDENFPEDVVYPESGLGWGETLTAYGMIEPLLALPEERRREIQVYCGHFPYVVTQMLGVDPVTMTMLREPVARTVSYLRHCRRHQERHRESSLEEIYDDMRNFGGFIWNHQSKVFAMTADDPLVRVDDVIEIDAARLEIAKRNLAAVDVVGLTERYGDFVDEVRERFGWSITGSERRNVGVDAVAPASLLELIAEDNAADLEFYEFASELCRRRATERRGADHA